MNETTEYRIEGNHDNGWILYDRTSGRDIALVFLESWRKAYERREFRLVRITTTVTREVMKGV